jgi:hypothetical protein
MSLDYTSLLGGPGPEELVPSRCAQRVGEIDVLVISDGVVRLPTATLPQFRRRRGNATRGATT